MADGKASERFKQVVPSDNEFIPDLDENSEADDESGVDDEDADSDDGDDLDEDDPIED